jgi:hypothetical protein
MTPDISPLRRLPLRWLLKRYLERGERILAEGPVHDLDADQTAYLVVTANRLLLAYLSEDETVYTLRFADVHRCLHRAGAMKITARAPGMLADDEAYELTIEYGRQRAVELAIADGIQRLSPLFRFSESTTERFRRAAATPVARWLVCPACVVELDQHVDHAAHCSRCGRYYADEHLRPVVGRPPGASGRLIGVEDRNGDASGTFGVRPFVVRATASANRLVLDRSLDRPVAPAPRPEPLPVPVMAMAAAAAPAVSASGHARGAEPTASGPSVPTVSAARFRPPGHAEPAAAWVAPAPVVPAPVAVVPAMPTPVAVAPEACTVAAEPVVTLDPVVTPEPVAPTSARATPRTYRVSPGVPTRRRAKAAARARAGSTRSGV